MPTRRRALLACVTMGGTAALIGCGSYLIWLRQSVVSASFFPSASMDDVCFFAPMHPWNGRGDPLAARPVPAEARCPVCGMYPSRHPRWAVQVIFADGNTHFLDSPLSLFHYLRQVERFAPGRRRRDVAAIYVSNVSYGDADTDKAMGSDRWLLAEQAYFVHGSDLMGPMRGGNLPAIASLEAAKLLVASHGGVALRFSTLDEALPTVLQSLRPHPH